MKVLSRLTSSSLVAAAAALAFFVVFGPRHAAGQGVTRLPPEVIADFMKQYEASPRVEVPEIKGTASVLIVKFTDYQCPGCAATYTVYKPVLEKYEKEFPGAIKYVVKDFPLDQSCASWMTQPLHTAACDAAVAVALARRQNLGGDMEAWLYQNQQMLNPSVVRKAAELVGGVKDFAGGYQQVIGQIKADIGLGRLLNVSATPTFFINGVKIDQAIQPDLFDAAIAYELKRAGKVK